MSTMSFATAARIQEHLNAIAAEFVNGAKLTLLVRNPSVAGDADAVFTNDTLPEAIKGLRRRLAISAGES